MSFTLISAFNLARAILDNISTVTERFRCVFQLEHHGALSVGIEMENHYSGRLIIPFVVVVTALENVQRLPSIQENSADPIDLNVML